MATTALIDEDIIELGVMWRWLKAQGLDYSEEKRDYEIALSSYALNNKSRSVLAQNGRHNVRRRGDYRAIAAP